MEEIVLALKNYDYDTVERLIEQMETIPIETFAYNSLCILLSCDDEETFPYITGLLEYINPYTDLHILNIVATFTLNRQVVEYTKRYIEDIGHMEFIMQWIEHQGGYFDNIGMICDIYLSVYGPLSNNVMKSMLEEITKRDKSDFYDVMFGFYSRTSEYAKVPGWISTRVTTEQELEEKYALLDHHEPIDDKFISQQLHSKVFEYINEDQEDLLRILKDLDDDKKDMLKDLLFIDDSLVPYFGPSNPFPLFLHDSKQERMLLCNTYLDEDDETWFDGSCDQCANRIRHEHHCLRMPQKTGGWDGCFCSWECLNIRADDEQQDLIVKIREEIEKRLIYDR